MFGVNLSIKKTWNSVRLWYDQICVYFLSKRFARCVKYHNECRDALDKTKMLLASHDKVWGIVTSLFSSTAIRICQHRVFLLDLKKKFIISKIEELEKEKVYLQQRIMKRSRLFLDRTNAIVQREHSDCFMKVDISETGAVYIDVFNVPYNKKEQIKKCIYSKLIDMFESFFHSRCCVFTFISVQKTRKIQKCLSNI